MQPASLPSRFLSLLAVALIFMGQPWVMTHAEAGDRQEYGPEVTASSKDIRHNARPTIEIELNRNWGLTPFEVEATITVTDPEQDPLQCRIFFNNGHRERKGNRFTTTGTNVHVRSHTYEQGDGVRHIRVYCRDFAHANGLTTADAYVTLNPCGGNGFNACGTCGDMPDLPCAAGDRVCEAQVARVCAPTCGDNSVTGPEACDGAIVRGETCASLNLGYGRLRCTSDCQGFEASLCALAPTCPESYPEPVPHTLIPDPPDRVRAAVEGCHQVRVAWEYNASTRNTSSRVPGLSGFVVYRDGVPIGETTGRETCRRKRGERAFVDETVESGSTYTYAVAALNNLGQVSQRVGRATVTTAEANGPECADTIAPPSPVNLRRQDSGTDCHDIRVAVDRVSDIGTGVRGYRYYLDGTDRCVEVAASHVSGGLRLQYSRGLHPGASYTAEVSAVDHAGNESARSVPLTVEVATCEQPSEYKTVVVLVTYPDMPPPPMTSAEVEAAVFGPVDSLNAFYEENSQSTVAILPAPGGGVTEWIVLPHDRLYYCEAVQTYTENGVGAYCDFARLRRDVNEILGDSIDFDDIDRAVYAFYGSGGANSAVNIPFGENGLNMSILVHETAHAWAGRQHAQGLTCPVGHQVPPDLIDPDLGCVLSEYGDAFDPMGSGSGHFSAHNKIEMGLLSTDALGFARANGFYVVEQLALPSEGRKEIRIPLGDHDFKDLAYSFEYRRPDGWDSALGIDGVIARVVGPDLQRYLETSDDDGRARQLILDSWSEPFVDPYRGIHVDVHSKNEERVVLHICRD